MNAHLEKVSEVALLESQAVSETWVDDTTTYMHNVFEAPGNGDEYRSKQTSFGITSVYAVGKSKAYSARLSDRYTNCLRVLGCMTYDTYTPL